MSVSRFHTASVNFAHNALLRASLLILEKRPQQEM
jgi:hypothetical protein